MCSDVENSSRDADKLAIGMHLSLDLSRQLSRKAVNSMFATGRSMAMELVTAGKVLMTIARNAAWVSARRHHSGIPSQRWWTLSNSRIACCIIGKLRCGPCASARAVKPDVIVHVFERLRDGLNPLALDWMIDGR